MTIGDWAARLRYRYVPDHLVGEVLGRRWMDNVIPVTLLFALTILSDSDDSEFHVGREICPTRRGRSANSDWS